MTLNLRRKLLLLGAPVVLAGAGLTTMAASAATPALPGGGHADSATDAEADHQFDGVE